MITREIIGFEEKSDPPAGLVADRGLLPCAIGFGKQ
jgi:hypothetical protein